jgi:sugar lactone lactonase YvrE
MCQHGNRAIGKLVSLNDSLQPEFELLATNYQGKRFNSPNDLTYDQNGNLYFTDPSYGLGSEKSEIGFNGVYFFNKKGGVILLDSTIENPNGIAVSQDNKTLYVADSNVDFPKILAFDIVEKGKIANKRLFFDATELRKASIDKQCPDGIKLDKHGNMFVAGPGGVLIISPEGKHLGTIRLDKPTGNCEFTDDGKFLFITCDDYLLRVNLKPSVKEKM